MLNGRAVALGLIVLLMCLPLFAQTSDKDLLARIRQAEANNSQIMKLGLFQASGIADLDERKRHDS